MQGVRGTFYKNFRGDIDLYLGKVRLTITYGDTVFCREGYMKWFLGRYENGLWWPDVEGIAAPHVFRALSIEGRGMVSLLARMIRCYPTLVDERYNPIPEIQVTPDPPKSLGQERCKLEDREFEDSSCASGYFPHSSVWAKMLKIQIDYL